jgi:hypothetical protein
MARETKIPDEFKVFLIPKDENFENEWRAKIKLDSKTRTKKPERTEYFNASISFPIESYNSSTPEEIKKEALVKFREAFIEITEWLKEQTV